MAINRFIIYSLVHHGDPLKRYQEHINSPWASDTIGGQTEPSKPVALDIYAG